MTLAYSADAQSPRRARHLVDGSRGDPALELEQTAATALGVLRRALVEGASVTRETVTHEAAVVFQTDPAEAVSRLDAQAQRLGVSSLM
jgi:hypothetical protein